MPKKVFDHDKMKNSDSQNIEIRNMNVEIIFWYSKLCIQNRVFLYSV